MLTSGMKSMHCFKLASFIAFVYICIPAGAFLSPRHDRFLLRLQNMRPHSTCVNMMDSCPTETQHENASDFQASSKSDSETDFFNEQYLHAYQQAIEEILSKKNVLRDIKKNADSLDLIKALLLDDKRKLPLWDINEFLSRTTTDNGTVTDEENVGNGKAAISYSKQRLHERRQMYLDQTGITIPQHKLATTLLSHLADHCAKTSQSKPLFVAWEKILEAGMTPMSRVLSTYLYVLGLEKNENQSDRDIPSEVAMFHDAIYEPTEKTITLLVKSLVQRGDAAGAEALLDGIAVSD